MRPSGDGARGGGGVFWGGGGGGGGGGGWWLIRRRRVVRPCRIGPGSAPKVLPSRAVPASGVWPSYALAKDREQIYGKKPSASGSQGPKTSRIQIPYLPVLGPNTPRLPGRSHRSSSVLRIHGQKFLEAARIAAIDAVFCPFIS